MAKYQETLTPPPSLAVPAKPADGDNRVDHRLDRHREALVLWLQWNNAYERVTAAQFAARRDPRKLEDLMDQMDRLRRDAIRLSQELLD